VATDISLPGGTRPRPDTAAPRHVDLATNRPGAHAIAAARYLRSQAPIRSRVGSAFAIPTREWAWRRAADAERRVAVALDRLGPTWRVLHSVPVGPDHPAISHLLISPAGVFSVLSRRHRAWRRQPVPERVEARVLHDEMLIDGESVPYVPQARAQAWRSAGALSATVGSPVLVRPVVVLVGCEDIRLHGPPDRVEVISRRHLLRWLRGFPEQYSPEEVGALFAAARHCEPWTDRATN
jgi:nuclease-like protein